jgi:hypothetical protein
MTTLEERRTAVTRLDRLARSTRDLPNVLASVTERGAGFRSLSDTWCDTTTPHGRLMLTVLGGLAEFERELIRAGTGEGRDCAIKNGARFGRPLKFSNHQRREALARLNVGESVVDVASTYGVDRATIVSAASGDRVGHMDLDTNPHFENSTLRERIVEHVFLGEALRALWRRGIVDVEVLRSEFEARGCDLVMARSTIVRHIQFKTGDANVHAYRRPKIRCNRLHP